MEDLVLDYHLTRIPGSLFSAAGLGTRLLPAAKELPNEMLPVFSPSANGKHCMKLLLQCIFEQLYDYGIREFYFVIGRGKRAVEDHFTQDHGYLRTLRDRDRFALDLERFYQKLSDSTIVWINQPEPRGFGDAILRAQTSLAGEEFLVNAGDTLVISRNSSHPKHLTQTHTDLKAYATFIVHEIQDPKQYGVVDAKHEQDEVYRVKSAVEKPDFPPSNLATIPLCIFHPIIFDALAHLKPGRGGEVQLTDAIQKLVDWRKRVYAVKLKSDETRLDVRTPETYWDALRLSFLYGV